MHFSSEDDALFFMPAECDEFGMEPDMTPERAFSTILERHATLHKDVRRGEEYAIEAMHPQVLDRIRFMREERDRAGAFGREMLDLSAASIIETGVERLQRSLD